MSKYALRKNFTATFSDREKTVRGKLAFKTKETDWLGTESSTVILVSIHSAFHEGEGGDLKMNALLSVVKNHVKGKVTVLLAAGAHLQTMSLDYQGNLELAFKECLASTLALSHRYRSYFKDCNVVDWHSYICEDKNGSSEICVVNKNFNSERS